MNFAESSEHAAEQYILGTLMFWGEGIDQCARLDSRHFLDPRNQRVWAAIKALDDEGQTYLHDAVQTLMQREETLEHIGGWEYLDLLLDCGVSPATLSVHTAELLNRRLLREVVLVGDKIASGADNAAAQAESILEEADREIAGLQAQRESRSEVSTRELMREAVEHLTALVASKTGITGLPTGFGDLDRMTNGLCSAALVLLAARPSVGKTALALNIARNVAVDSKRAAVVFSLEMGKRQLGTRLYTMAARVSKNRFVTKAVSDADYVRLDRARGELQAAPLTIVESFNLTPAELRAHAKKLRAQGKLDVLIVDYLQLMSADAESAEQRVSEISRSLKLLAKELDAPVLALSQLNREVEKRGDKRPSLADLRGSGSLEQDADGVWFIHRDDENPGKATIIVAKNRDGGIGDVQLRFDPDTQRFDSIGGF